MPRPSDEQRDLLSQLIGLGDRSLRKNYYPQLRQRAAELERFRLLFDHGNDLILLVDMSSQRIIDANEPVCAFLGRGSNDLKGRRLMEFLPDRVVDSIEALQRADPGQSIRCNTIFCRRDGRVVPVEMTCRIATIENEATALLVARDITERLQFETDLENARDEAERASMAKSRFLAAASHDLRQPFQAMALYQSVLEGALAGTPQEPALRALGSAMAAGQELLSALLDVSTLDAGIIKAQMTDLALGPLLRDLASEFAPQMAEQKLSFRCLETTLWGRSDAALLARILRNLLSNALKYTPQGRVVVGCRRKAESLRIEIWDTGIGIADMHTTEIFEDFVQLANPERDRARGLGLGLAIVARCARLLGHKVEVCSRPGAGSVFSVEVERVQPPESAAS